MPRCHIFRNGTGRLHYGTDRAVAAHADHSPCRLSQEGYGKDESVHDAHDPAGDPARLGQTSLPASPHPAAVISGFGFARDPATSYYRDADGRHDAAIWFGNLIDRHVTASPVFWGITGDSRSWRCRQQPKIPVSADYGSRWWGSSYTEGERRLCTMPVRGNRIYGQSTHIPLQVNPPADSAHLVSIIMFPSSRATL